MKLVLLMAMFFSFTASAAMTEAQCQNQAKAVYTLLQMVDDGSLPANEQYLEKLAKADKLYREGEYCAARSIVLNLNQ